MNTQRTILRRVRLGRTTVPVVIRVLALLLVPAAVGASCSASDLLGAASPAPATVAPGDASGAGPVEVESDCIDTSLSAPRPFIEATVQSTLRAFWAHGGHAVAASQVPGAEPADVQPTVEGMAGRILYLHELGAADQVGLPGELVAVQWEPLGPRPEKVEGTYGGADTEAASAAEIDAWNEAVTEQVDRNRSKIAALLAAPLPWHRGTTVHGCVAAAAEVAIASGGASSPLLVRVVSDLIEGEEPPLVVDLPAGAERVMFEIVPICDDQPDQCEPREQALEDWLIDQGVPADHISIVPTARFALDHFASPDQLDAFFAEMGTAP